MSLFSKKKEASCCCGCKCNDDTMATAEKSKATGEGIKILGTGCAKCNALEEATKEALAKLEINEKIEHVTDYSQIASYGVMTTPALVVDGKVVSLGKVLKVDEVVELLKKARG